MVHAASAPLFLLTWLYFWQRSSFNYCSVVVRGRVAVARTISSITCVRLLGKSICGMCEIRCLAVYLEGRPASFIYLWTLLTMHLASAVHLLSADIVSVGGRYELKYHPWWADEYTIPSITACPGHFSCGVSTTATPTSWWWRRRKCGECGAAAVARTA